MYVENISTQDGALEFTAMDGTRYRLDGQEQSWQEISRVPEELQYPLSSEIMNYFQRNQAGDILAGYVQFPRDEEGNINYDSFTYEHALFLADGTRIQLDLSDQEYIAAAACDERGTF